MQLATLIFTHFRYIKFINLFHFFLMYTIYVFKNNDKDMEYR